MTPSSTTTTTSSTTIMASIASLEQIIRLNNEGTAMLASSNERLSRQAMNLFREALTCMDGAVSSLHGARTTPTFSVDDICQFCMVPIPSEGTTEDSAVYFHRHGIYLKGSALVQVLCRNDDDKSAGTSLAEIIRLFLAVVLMNTSLACYKVGRCFALQQTHEYREKATELFRRSLHLYVEVFHLYVSSHACKSMAYFAMIAKNNMAWIFLYLGYKGHAKQAQLELLRLIQIQASVLDTPQAQDVAREFYLNTTVMSMTGYLSHLPAGAA